MKKKLIFQSLIPLAASCVITILIMMCMSGSIISVGDISVRTAAADSEFAVIENGDIVYSTLPLSRIDMQSLVITAQNSGAVFSYHKKDYIVQTSMTSDGATVVRLTEKTEPYAANRLIFAICSAVFFAAYIMITIMVFKKNESEIIRPLCNLKKQTHMLTEGDYNINIPDEGSNEIYQLSREIENLRLRLKEDRYLTQKTTENRKFLISSISHDLRTPVTALRGYLEGILDGIASDPEKRDAYIRKALEKTELINRMINDLLLYSKLDMNQVEFKLQDIDIADYLSAFADDNKLLFENEGKSISFDMQLKKRYTVKIDIQQFDRVMNNIVSNALKYIKSGCGEVNIILRENVSSIIIEIKDNGSGIKKENIGKIFDRFYRAEETRTMDGSSGLGLAISKQIVENMGGRIWAVSELGEGTSILIALKKHSVSLPGDDSCERTGE